MPVIVKRQSKNYYWQYDEDILKTLSADHFTHQYWHALGAITGQEKGRGTTWFISHNNHNLVLRHYLRGGLVGKLIHDSYFYRSINACRSISEFNILSKLHARGLPVPQPAAAQVIRLGVFYRADILIKRIPLAHDLLHLLQKAQSSEFYQQLGNTIARFHLHGVYHADLNIQNILQDKSGQFWLIDFDQAKVLKPQKKWQSRNMQRLKRSFEKEHQRHGIQWTSSCWHELSKAYNIAMQG